MIFGVISGGRLTGVALPWALLPLVSMVISQIHPVYSPRYLLFTVPAMALIAGAGLDALRPRASACGRRRQNSAFVEDDERYLALMGNRDFVLRFTDDFGYSWIGLYARRSACCGATASPGASR
ncbi:hypothetical protein OG884_00995 [Streptosporangium sp. NBC_01755]|uniref:hypothetical protein n=1 Tax=unclassified Streptosporangium TaxID=2632669 RepID=UPI002DD9CE01|nr:MULTISPECIES: hypothetical protein [unclassified Streptosporangium]WSA27978.1 hypothetical protein OIE13_08975 [Streptosporangium sp. NBC_01810]WSD00551.1 hypothetical protein OG884_00995 [Streptosporangium sp. NBC_01755]